MNLLLTFLLVGISLTAAAQKETDLAAERLKGPVHTITIRGYKGELVGGRVTNGQLLHTTTKAYNSNGFLTETNFKLGFESMGGKPVRTKSSRAYYRYDDNGHLIGSVSYNDDDVVRDSSVQIVDKMGNRTHWIIFRSDGSKRWQFTSEYDINGNLLETMEYNDEQLSQRHSYRYDDNNRRTLEILYTGDGRVAWRETFKYDELGNKTEVTDFNSNGSFKARYTYQYNETGKPVEEHVYKSDTSELYEKVLTKYDEEGNPVEIKQYSERGVLEYIGKLDKYGNHLSDVEYAPNGTVLHKMSASYKYDEQGNETEEYNRYPDGSTAKTKSSYVYDMYGNWVRKVVVEEGDVIRIVERMITYYKR